MGKLLPLVYEELRQLAHARMRYERPGQTLQATALVLEWDELLDKLHELDSAMATVVKLRYFAGFSTEETAQALDVSRRTVNRHWTAAQAWLRMQLSGDDNV
jgi:RNA polymerase sigma factor (sigma-70 family)